jgi:hypothetical protein
MLDDMTQNAKIQIGFPFEKNDYGEFIACTSLVAFG